jgi:hypothetical protein
VTDNTYRDNRIAHFDSQVASLAHAYRRIADAIEREGNVRADRPFMDGGRWLHAVDRILHEITWGAAGAAPHHLIRTAEECDRLDRLDQDGDR